MGIQKREINGIQSLSEKDKIQRQVSSSLESVTVEEIQTWLICYLAELLDIKPGTVDIFKPFANYGLDSAAAVVIVGDLENWLKRKLEIHLLSDYPTIEKLSLYLGK